jgi:hypothetical protein
MKKLKIVKNPLTQSLTTKDIDHLNLLNIYPNSKTSTISGNNNYYYNINKINQPKPKKGKLTFDNVFNSKATNAFLQNAIPPIIFGNMQNQPQISININNFNINSYTSGNKSKEMFASPKKEPIRVFNYPRVNENQSRSNNVNVNNFENKLSNSRIKLVKRDLPDDESFSILPHSNSNIITKSKKVNISLIL